MGNGIDDQTGGGERSDTTMLLHVVGGPEDRRTASSLARDTMVDRPDCKVDGETIPGEEDVLFNDAFSVGGPLCTVQQVEHLTGIYIDHTVVVDFDGFKDMVDAVARRRGLHPDRGRRPGARHPPRRRHAVRRPARRRSTTSASGTCSR